MIRRTIKIVAIGGLVIAITVNIVQRLAPQEDLESELNSLKTVMPQADLFSEKRGQPPHYEAYKEEKGEENLVGLCFTTTDVVQGERGYVGPIKIMVGMDLEGEITGVKILHHTETPSYVRELKSPWFSDQFKGKRISDNFKVNEDIDGITGATVTSEAVARAVKRSVRKVGLVRLNLCVEAEEGDLGGSAKVETYILSLLFAVAVGGFIKKDKRFRYAVLAVALIFLGFLEGSPVSMVNIASVLSLRLPILTYNIFWYLLIGFVLVTTLALGRIYCGWICPFGAVTELLNKIKIPKLNISERVDKKAKHIKYILLWLLVIVPLLLNDVNASNYEPFGTFFSRIGGLLAWAFLILILGSELFINRFWCRYLCAVGAALGLISRVSVWKVRAKGECGACSRCVTACQVRAKEKEPNGRLKIDPSECIGCDEHVRDCHRGILVVAR